MTIETRTIQPFPARRTAVVTGAGAPRGIGLKKQKKKKKTNQHKNLNTT
jgi:hypothetical protein